MYADGIVGSPDRSEYAPVVATVAKLGFPVSVDQVTAARAAVEKSVIAEAVWVCEAAA